MSSFFFSLFGDRFYLDPIRTQTVVVGRNEAGICSHFRDSESVSA
jgi:hypothetical protein